MSASGNIRMIHVAYAIALVSISIIAFQLVLMQVLSYIQWYHFAYMIISIALLGFGAAGTFLTIFRKRLLKDFDHTFAYLLFITASLMSFVVKVAGTEGIRFDSLLIFYDVHYIGRLVASYLIFFLPFFCGALAIGMSFLKFSGQIGKIYFANLAGSGLGGLIALGLMLLMPAEQIPSIIAGITFLGGILVFPKNATKLLWITAAVSVVILMFNFIYPPHLKPSEYKDISKALLLPDAGIEYEKSSPYGLLQIVSSPVLRNASGVSFAYRELFPVRKAVFTNGNGIGYLVPEDQAKTSLLNYSTQSLPYRIENIDKALILNAGTGENISLALSHGLSTVVANEANAEVFALLQNAFDNQPQLKLHQSLARSLLVKDSSYYDLIQLPVIGTFFGNSGLNAVEVNHDLSMESLHKIWERLSSNGMICLSCWMDYPVRNAYKLLASIGQLLEEENIKYPEQHIMVIRSWNALTFLVKKSNFNVNQENQARQFCDDLMFDPLILPTTKEIFRGKYNLIQDTSFFANVEKLVYKDRKEFVSEYPYRVNPITDNRPYFYQNLRWGSIRTLMTSFKNNNSLFMELGYLLVLLTFLQIIVMAGILIVLPLLFGAWKSNNKLWVILYFSCIGLAYMFVEMVFIQQFTFYFGQPVYATAASVSILLIASGFGSYYSGSFVISKKRFLLFQILVAIILLFHSFFLSALLSGTMGLGLPLKIVFSIVLIGISGFFMGIPFPAGIHYLSERKQTDIPWAWALNGYFSVISAALAIIISVEAGFVLVLFLAAMAYAFAGLSILFLKN